MAELGEIRDVVRERYAGAARIVCDTARDITAILSAETPA